MTDKKLTDSNLIKTCKDCFHYEPCFSGGASMWNNIEQTPEDCCQYFVPTPEKETYNGMDFCGVPCKFMEDKIHRLQAEIKVKNKLLDIAEAKFETIKAEAYKECIKKVKEILDLDPENTVCYFEMTEAHLCKVLDNLLKTLEGEDHG